MYYVSIDNLIPVYLDNNTIFIRIFNLSEHEYICFHDIQYSFNTLIDTAIYKHEPRDQTKIVIAIFNIFVYNVSNCRMVSPYLIYVVDIGSNEMRDDGVDIFCGIVSV